MIFLRFYISLPARMTTHTGSSHKSLLIFPDRTSASNGLMLLAKISLHNYPPALDVIGPVSVKAVLATGASPKRALELQQASTPSC